MNEDNANSNANMDVISQQPQPLSQDNHLNLVGTVMIGRTEEEFANIQPQAEKMSLLADALGQKGFEVIYIGIFGVAISAPAPLYNEVFGLELDVDTYQNTMHFIDFIDNDNEALKHEALSLHFSGEVEYFGRVDEMEGEGNIRY